MPQWYLDEPKIDTVQGFYLTAFYELSTTRSIGMAPGPIPWHRILEYARYAELEKDVEKAFVIVIMSMDAGYLEYGAEQDRKNRERSKRKK